MGRLRARPGRYVLFRRGKYWYYWTYDDYGKRLRFSTGERRKMDAEDECERRKNLGCLIYYYEPKKKPASLAEYGTGFWNYDTCPVIQDKLLRGGRFSKKLAITYQGYFNNHIKPVLGSKSLVDITKQDVRSWLLSLPQKGLARKSANNILGSLRAILDQAVDEGLLDHNVANQVKPLIAPKKRRGAFTQEQVRLLFSTPWEDRYAYIGCFLASRTGMRVGEIRALSSYQIHPDYILVDASWSDHEGRKCTKSGFSRKIPITDEIYDLLQEIMPPRPGLLFTRDGFKPVGQNWFTNALKRRMDMHNGKLPDKITQTEGYVFDYLNKDKRLSFHSFRHYLNTRLIAAEMPESKIQAIIGHESAEMTEHYAHLEVEDLQIFRKVQMAI